MRRHSKPRTLPIGTISSGTLRLEDLIPALIGALEDLRLTRQERKTVNAVRADVESNSDYFEPGEHEAHYPCDDYDTLCHIADAHVPDYCYFGSLEGDGAEIGVWPDLSSVEEGGFGSHPEVIRARKDVEARTIAKDHPDAAYALEVNDHGNTTLYRRAGRRWIEVWSVG